MRSPLQRTVERWSDARLLTKSLLIVGVPVLALIVTVAISLGLQGRESSYRTTAIAINADLNSSQQAVQSFYEADSFVRGSVATGDQSSLRSFDTVVPTLVGWLGALRAEPNVNESRAVTAVMTDGHHEIAVLDEIRRVAVGSAGAAGSGSSRVTVGGDGEATSVLVARDDVSMGRLQRDLQSLIAEQRAASLVQRSKIVDAQDLSEWFLIAGLAVGVLGGVLGTVLLSTSIVRRVKLVGVNAQRFLVSQPLEEMPDSADEIGQLSDVIITAGSLLAERNREIAAARDDALAANQAKDEFLSRMSHELRTPLTAILGFGQLLQLEQLGDEDRESVDHIVRAGEHLLSLINEVLDIAQVTQGRLDLLFETVDVDAVVREAVALMGPAAAERGVTIDVVRPAADLAALADRQRLHQILLNLLSNAIKYNRPTGSVTVAIQPEHDGDGIDVAVVDTGPGIEESQLERVFIPFDRLSAAHSTIEGTGVGLPLARALSEAMGGTLTFRSEVGVGSTFTIRLVRDVKGSTAGGPSRRPTVGHPDGDEPRHGRTVLYAENDLANLRILQRVLRHRPELLQVAVQGQSCLDLARQLDPALILVELHLPDIRGEEVLHRLKADPLTAGIPVAVFGADVGPGRTGQLVQAGALTFLPAPLDVRRLIALLDQVGDATT
jgi:signal transduction histidine kinase/ActR/RegA family two-component response regulator